MSGRSPRVLVLLLLAVCGAGFVPATLEAQEARNLRHILVRTEAQTDALLDLLEKGEDFRALARKYSLDHGTKPLGGDLSWVVPAQMEPEFARAAFAIPTKGGWAKCKTRYGWHVIEYVDSRPAPGARPAPPARPDPSDGGPGVVAPVPAPRNTDLRVSVDWPERSFASGEALEFSIEIENTTDEPIDVFNPELWPLGLVVRYQFGRLNQAFTVPEEWQDGPPGGFEMILGPGEKHRADFTLQDYFGEREDWPIIRMIWRGDSLFSRMEKEFPSVIETEKYPVRKGRWRYYVSEESRINVLPDYDPADSWYLCFYARGRIWVEIQDPGVPGVIEGLLRKVRDESYNDLRLNVFEPEQWFGLARGKSPDMLPYFRPKRALEWGPGVVAANILWSGKQGFVGDNLLFALERPDAAADEVLPIGRIVHTEGNPLQRVPEAMASAGFAGMSLVLAYPEALAPPVVVEAAKALGEPVLGAGPAQPAAGAVAETVFAPLTPSRAAEREEGDEAGDELRRAPPTAELPQIEMVTNRGRIVVELYEDEAPNTVANFVNLVSAGFYKNNEILRREGNEFNKGFIQTGSPDNTVNGSPGYSIRDERNRHRHLRGSLSMARKHAVPNTAGSQFFICLDEQPQLDDIYTVFGTVIEGMNVVSQLSVGDRIESMRVLRKRDHEYQPETIPH